MSTPITHASADEAHGSLTQYVCGFILSLLLTMTAYLAVTNHVASGWALVGLLLGLAVAQFVVQLVFFLQLGREMKPRWKQLALFFMIGIVLILVLGSIWIMYNLNYRMMPQSPQQIEQYMKEKDGGI